MKDSIARGWKILLRAFQLTGRTVVLTGLAVIAAQAAELPKEGEPGYMQAMRAEAQDGSRPMVIAVTPANDATKVNCATELRLRFDRPMQPLSLELDWYAGGFLACEPAKYDPDKFEFTIPVHLAAGELQRIVVNDLWGAFDKQGMEERRKFRNGFQSVDHHQARLFVWQFQTQATPPHPDATPPKVTGLSPEPGSIVSCRALLDIEFDRPMKSREATMIRQVSNAPEARRVEMLAGVRYDTARQSFRIPLILPKNEEVRFIMDGFESADGVPAEPIKIQYHVSNREVVRTEREPVEGVHWNSRLLELLRAMQTKRAQLHSLIERVQNVISTKGRSGLFVSLRACESTFKWQSPDLFYADVSGNMRSANYRLGSDGQRWWLFRETGSMTNLEVCPANEMQELNISIVDPFDLTHDAPAIALAKLGLDDVGVRRIAKSDRHLVEAWSSRNLSQVEWQIDPEELRPVEVTEFFSSQVVRRRFFYDLVNEPLAAREFAMPQPRAVPTTPAEPLDEEHTRHFINLRDGADGNLTVRWGRKGPKGNYSSGLN